MSENQNKIPDENVVVKVSYCQACNGIVCAAVLHLMSKKEKKKFAKEAFKFNLKVDSISLEEYRKTNNWCKCRD